MDFLPPLYLQLWRSIAAHRSFLALSVKNQELLSLTVCSEISMYLMLICCDCSFRGPPSLPSFAGKWRRGRRGLLAGCSIGQLPFHYIAGFVGWTSCHLGICSSGCFGVASRLTDLYGVECEKSRALIFDPPSLPSFAGKWRRGRRGLLAGCSIGQLPFHYIAGFVGWTSCHLGICSSGCFGVASRLTDLYGVECEKSRALIFDCLQ